MKLFSQAVHDSSLELVQDRTGGSKYPFFGGAYILWETTAAPIYIEAVFVFIYALVLSFAVNDRATSAFLLLPLLLLAFIVRRATYWLAFGIMVAVCLLSIYLSDPNIYYIPLDLILVTGLQRETIKRVLISAFFAFGLQIFIAWQVPFSTQNYSHLPIFTTYVVFLLIGTGLRAWRASMVSNAQKTKLQNEINTRKLSEESAIAATKIAGFLHDSVGHDLTSIMALTQGIIATSSKNDGILLHLETIYELSENALERTRNIVKCLDSSAPVEDVIFTLEDIEKQARAFELLGIRVNLKNGIADSPSEIIDLMYRVVHEALNNAIRHSPNLEWVSVMLGEDDNSFYLNIENGMETSRESMLKEDGSGLNRLKSKVNNMGGKMSWGVTTEKSWLVNLTIPRIKA